MRERAGVSPWSVVERLHPRIDQLRAGAPAAADLERRGHRLERRAQPLGGAQAIWIDHDENVLVAASDPRKGGCTVGY